MRKKCLQYLLHKGSPGVQLIIAIRAVEILRVIIAKNSWSKEQAMEFIGIPKSEFAKYAALL